MKENDTVDSPISVAFDLQTLRGSDSARDRNNAKIFSTLQELMNAVHRLESKRESVFDFNQLTAVLDTYLEAWRQLDELGENDPARAIEEAKSTLRLSQFLFRGAFDTVLKEMPDWAEGPPAKGPELQLE